MIAAEATSTTPTLPLPKPPANGFSHYYHLNKKKLTSSCLRLMAEQLVPEDPPIDPRSVHLPLPFATILDDLGYQRHTPTACSEETAKKIQAFLIHRSVPRHKIPKVSMRADGMHALRAVGAREAKLYHMEQTIKSNMVQMKLLDTKVRESAASSWKESVDFGSSVVDEMNSFAKSDISRYHTEMKTFYKSVQCECAKKKVCRGEQCICTCYFCSVDRTHSMAGRCECSRTHRRKKIWCGSIKKTNKHPNQRNTVQYKTKSETKCNCLKHKNCAIHGCDCYCGYCLREKALSVQRNESKNVEYCPCSTSEICQDSRTCFCRCYKCSCEKNIMGICPFRPPQVV